MTKLKQNKDELPHDCCDCMYVERQDTPEISWHEIYCKKTCAVHKKGYSCQKWRI